MAVKINKETLIKNTSIGLYQARWGQNIGQPELSAETGITQQQLSDYEKGNSLPSLITIVALADALDVSIDYLVGRCSNSQAHKTTKTFTYKEESNHASI